MQSSSFDKEHDMILAVIAWVEEGIPPDQLIGSRFVGDDINQGVQFQRKLCSYVNITELPSSCADRLFRYPAEGAFVGGDPASAESFECRSPGAFAPAPSFKDQSSHAAGEL